MNQRVERFLAHYASEYYDPAKAKAYYERTKKLKGRKKANALTSKEQSDAWAVAKDSIGTARTKELTDASNSATAEMEAARAQAAATAERIQAKLTDFLQQVMSDTPIPGNASPQLRAFLEKQRSNRARGAIKEANADLQQLGQSLKKAIATAREAYAANKQAIKDKYDQASETEYNNIRTKVKGATAAKSKTASKKKATPKAAPSKRRAVVPKAKPKAKPKAPRSSSSSSKRPVAKSAMRGSSSKRAV